MRFSESLSHRLLPLFLLPTIAVWPAIAQTQQPSIVPGQFRFRTFQVPNQIQLGVENINNFGAIIGYYQAGTPTLPGPLRGFELSPWGKLQTFTDPLDIEQPSDPFGGVTEGLGINDSGVIVGEYWDVAAAHYAGFFLINGKYVTYNVPGYFNTVVQGINDDLTDFVGFVQTGAPNFFTSAFVSDSGKVSIFTVPGALLTEAIAINNFDQVVGIYQDSNQVFHGFLRDAKGNLKYPIDVPGATTAANLGTIALGINDWGVLSGHFWDAANIEHGFVRTPGGRFLQIDVPGAAQTAGGGINDFGVVVGHWDDQSGNQIGYIAIPNFDPDK
jgi:hypothetical protein